MSRSASALCTEIGFSTMTCKPASNAAIPNVVHEIHALILTGIRELDVTEPQREALRAHVYTLSEQVRESYRQDKSARPFDEVLAAVGESIDW